MKTSCGLRRDSGWVRCLDGEKLLTGLQDSPDQPANPVILSKAMLLQHGAMGIEAAVTIPIILR